MLAVAWNINLLNISSKNVNNNSAPFKSYGGAQISVRKSNDDDTGQIDDLISYSAYCGGNLTYDKYGTPPTIEYERKSKNQIWKETNPPYNCQ